MTIMTDIAVDGTEVLEWLRARNKVGKDWAQKLKVIRLKQEEVLAEVRKAGIDNVDAILDKERRDKDTPLSYADLLELQERVTKSKEAEARTLFGGYAHPAVKSVVALVKLYQRDNLHVISLAHEMTQVITFDLVAAKKAVKGYEAQGNDLSVKIGLFQASIRNSRHEIVQMARKYVADFELEESKAEKMDFPGLIGRYMRRFGSKADAVVATTRKVDIRKLVDYYDRFGQLNDARAPLAKDFEVLVWLAEKGDTLVSEWVNRRVAMQCSSSEIYEDILAQKGYGQTMTEQQGGLTS